MSCDGYQLARASIRAMQPYQPGKPTETLERELGLPPGSSIKLASNENPLGISAKVAQAITQRLSMLSRYPDGNGFQLKQALAHHLQVSSDQLTLGNGSNDVLALMVQCFATSADEVIFSQHAFAVYALATQAVGAKAVVTPARNWAHDLDAMAAAITERTRLIFIANPNNPTGTWLSKGELKAFLNSVPDHVLVVLDEAYCEYVDQENYPDGIKLQKQCDNLIVTRTFSKAYGLAGLRVGYAVSSAAIADVLNRIRQPFNVNELAQVAALAALQDQDYLARSRNVNNAGLDQLADGFDALGLSYIPSVANFICAQVGEQAETIFNLLLQQGVIVRPVANYQMPQWLRVSVGLQAENERFLSALRSALERGA